MGGCLAYRDDVTSHLDNKFDGDATNVALSLDAFVAEGLENLAPHKSICDLKNHRGISDCASLSKTVVATIANWLDDI